MCCIFKLKINACKYILNKERSKNVQKEQCLNSVHQIEVGIVYLIGSFNCISFFQFLAENMATISHIVIWFENKNYLYINVHIWYIVKLGDIHFNIGFVGLGYPCITSVMLPILKISNLLHYKKIIS